MGQDQEGAHSKESLFDPDTYQRGIRRWFSMFYNSSTDKFIAYFTKLV
jgi:hypothetical protein